MKLGIWALPLFVLVVSSAASAQTLALLTPGGAVSPAGFSVALVRKDRRGVPKPLLDPQLDASGAVVERLGDAGDPPWIARFSVRPNEGVKRVTLRASDGPLRASAELPVGPRVEKISLSLDPPAPVKGRDAEATLTVELRRPDGTLDAEASPPVVRVNVGSIESLAPAGPGRFRARYVLPKTRYPEVVVLAAFSAWPDPGSVYGAAGSLLVPLASAIDLPGTTEPFAQMSLEIAGVSYGPTRAGQDGRFKLPVVVPPGHRFAKGTAVDRAGNRRVVKVDLMLPPTDRLSCVMTPTRLPARPRALARIVCATTDEYGKPMAGAHVAIAAERGRIGAPHPLGPGLIEWSYRAPDVPSLDPDQVRASWRQGGPLSVERFDVQFEQGPAAKLNLTAAAPVAFRTGSVGLELSVADANGSPREGAGIEIVASEGKVSPPERLGGGRYQARYAPDPNGTAKEARLVATALGPPGTEPHRFIAYAEDGALYAGVVDLANKLVPNQPIAIDGTSADTGPKGIVRIGPLEDGSHVLQHRQWRGLKERLYSIKGVLVPRAERPAHAEASAKLKLGPPVPVDVRLSIEGGRVTYWAEDPSGRVLEGRALELAVSGGTADELGSEAGKRTAQVRANGAATVSVRDQATGVTAVAEVRP